LLARAIHHGSARGDKSFVIENRGARKVSRSS
jgi:transcriptional regulator with PAS, ATPase and Fis domain